VICVIVTDTYPAPSLSPLTSSSLLSPRLRHRRSAMSVILATAGHDDKIRFWEAPSGICSRVLRYADSQVNCLEITPDKQYLAAGGNPHIRLFEINNSSNQNPILTLEGHTGNVTSLGFQRNGRYLYSGSEDGTVKLWDLRSPTFSRSFDSKGAVNSVSLHPNQTEIISGELCKVKGFVNHTSN
jgi:G protein beta subunit-like protein